LEQGIKVAGVTKVLCGNLEIAKSLINNGVTYLADSRIENLKNFSKIQVEKWLLRLPMEWEADEVVKYADVSLNSELYTIRLLNHFAEKNNKYHKVILMVDLGDLREGYYNIDELYEDLIEILKMKNIKVYGIGCNLTCYGAVIPDEEKMLELLEVAQTIESRFGIKLEIISGGNSSSIPLVLGGNMPKGINNLRLGDSIVIGRETAYCNNIPNMHSDAMILEVQIIELKNKATVPTGKIGVDVFGQTPVFADLGSRKKAIVAIGKQDVEVDDLTPLDSGIIILGASSDHMILDVTESDSELFVGSVIKFRMGYTATLRTMTSQYVNKVIHS
jgi:predicted amino acid racemase